MKLLDILQGDDFDMLCEEAIFDDETYTVEHFFVIRNIFPVI